MEHLEYFELPSDPFQNEADARFYYESAPQKRARLRLLRGIHQKKALSVLVGGPGLGKTTLAHVVMRALEDKEYVTHYLSIPHEACASGWLLPNVARGFGVPVPSSQVSVLIDQLHAQLVAITTGKRTPVLLIDEAQLFRNREAMEEFRGLLNLTHDGKKLLSLVLFGLHELGEILKLDPPLAQRVEVRVEMTPMDWLESQAYVSHRLRLAGATSAVFSPDALEALFRWSGGVPRLLNTLADNSLFEAFLTETKPVDSTVVQTAAEGLGLHRVPSDSVPNFPPMAPPAPDLLSVTQVELPSESESRPARAPQTMPIARPSPAARAPEPKPKRPTPFERPVPRELEPDFAVAAIEPEASDSSQPDWLEPLSPMPEAVAMEATPESVEPEMELEPLAAEDLEMDLEEVIPEDTRPPTPATSVRVVAKPAAAKPVAKPVVHESPDPDEAEEVEDADEVALGMDDDDEADFSLGSLAREVDAEPAIAIGDDSDDSEEEAAIAELGGDDDAPVRRTPPLSRPAAVTPAKAKPTMTAARPSPARPTPSKSAPTRAVGVKSPVTPAKPSPAIPSNGEDSFDLRSLMVEEDTGSVKSPGMLKPPAKDDDDDLDALFDEIQIGDK